MHKLLITALATGLLGTAMAGTAAAADIGISINVAQPGFFGRIDLGAVPTPPPLVMAAPVVVERAPVGEVREPVYLHVPPGHERHWAQHCHEYNACGVPVYFVQDRWYNEVYVPRARVVREPVREVREVREDREDREVREPVREERDMREVREEQHDKGRGRDKDDWNRGRDHERDHDHDD
jgi:hypothetical protein